MSDRPGKVRSRLLYYPLIADHHSASAECVKILCEHYKIAQAGHHVPPAFQLFLLNFPRLHSLVLKFFIRSVRQLHFPLLAHAPLQDVAGIWIPGRRL